MQVDYVRIYDQTAPLQITATKTNGYVLLTWSNTIVAHLQSQTNSGTGVTTTWSDVTGASASP